jgi:hypothetical protein
MYLECEVLQFGIGSGRPFGTGPVVLPWVVLGSNKHPRGTLSTPLHNLIQRARRRSEFDRKRRLLFRGRVPIHVVGFIRWTPGSKHRARSTEPSWIVLILDDHERTILTRGIGRVPEGSPMSLEKKFADRRRPVHASKRRAPAMLEPFDY